MSWALPCPTHRLSPWPWMWRPTLLSRVFSRTAASPRGRAARVTLWETCCPSLLYVGAASFSSRTCLTFPLSSFYMHAFNLITHTHTHKHQAGAEDSLLRGCVFCHHPSMQTRQSLLTGSHLQCGAGCLNSLCAVIET